MDSSGFLVHETEVHLALLPLSYPFCWPSMAVPRPSLFTPALLKNAGVGTLTSSHFSSSPEVILAFTMSTASGTSAQRYHHEFDYNKREHEYDFRSLAPEFHIASAFKFLGERVNSLRYYKSVQPATWASLRTETWKVAKEHCGKQKVYPGISEITLDPMYDVATDEVSVQSEIVYHQSCQDSGPSKYTNVTLKWSPASTTETKITVVDGPRP